MKKKKSARKGAGFHSHDSISKDNSDEEQRGRFEHLKLNLKSPTPKSKSH